MLFEYAITPDVFDATSLYADEAAARCLLDLLHGISKHGMIASLDPDIWLKNVTGAIEKIPLESRDREKLRRCLVRLMDTNRLVEERTQGGRERRQEDDWLTAILTIHKNIKFHAIVVSSPRLVPLGRNEAPILPLKDILDDNLFRVADKTTRLVRRTVSDVRAALAPVLRHAKKITLIDPYIAPGEERWNRLFRMINSLAGPDDTRHGWRVELVVNAPARSSPDLGKWREALNGLLSPRFRVTVNIWSVPAELLPAHDRCIITNQCGISCPGGLDSYPDTDRIVEKHDWALMDEDAINERNKLYERNSSPYDLVASIQFSPNPKRGATVAESRPD